MSFEQPTQEIAATKARVVPGGTEEFEALRHSNFPGMDESQAYSKHLPHMAILLNTSHFRIKAYTVLWSVGTAEFPASRQWVSSFMQLHCMRLQSLRHIEPKDMRLLSVSLNVSPAEHKLLKSKSDFSKAHLNPLDPDECISASMDCAIYSDGTMEGPDTKGLLPTYTATRNAEHDEAYSVHRHIAAGIKTERELTEILASHAKWNEGVYQGPEGVYWSTRRVESKRLLARLSSKGVPHLEACIARRLAYSPVRVKVS